MTNGYIINIGNASAKQWVQLNFERTLNGISNSQLVLDSVTPAYLAEFANGATTSIYKNGTVVFTGKIKKRKKLGGGGLILTIQGMEIELVEDKCFNVMVGSNITRAFTSTNDNTVINTLVTSVSGWTTDINNSTPTSIDSFRVSASESIWNAVIRIISITGKDIYIDQANKILYVYDSFTRASKFSFVEGKNASNIIEDDNDSVATVKVFGKGDGVNQIIGTFGSGSPTEVIIDRNIISTSEANLRAESEYNRLNTAASKYSLTPMFPIDSLLVGDSGTIINTSAGINATVDIVRIKTGVSNKGRETVDLEVTNPEYRIASKNNREEIYKTEANYNLSQSSMQGSGNTLSWAGGINAKNGSPLSVIFYLSPDLVSDDAGNLRISSITLDYDVDPYRSGIGTVSETDKEPSLAASTKAALHGHTPYETGSGHDHTNPATTADVALSFESDTTYNKTTGSATNISSGAWVTVDTTPSTNISISECFHLQATIDNDSASEDTFYARVQIGSSSYYPSSAGVAIVIKPDQDGYISLDVPVQCFTGTPLANYNIQFYSNQAGTDVYVDHWWVPSHIHNISSYNSNDKLTSLNDVDDDPSVTGKTALHAHDVAVGDDISDAGSINSSQVSIYLDFWNGSTWVNKHSILNTGKTIDTDVDISNSDAYPDVVGFWRVRIDPSSASPDLVQGIVKIKHSLDN